jgi:hypothetical protein
MAGPHIPPTVAREVGPAFTLHQIGKLALSRARAGERLANLDLLTAMLMCPLTMEAVLNHIGVRVFSSNDWTGVERLSPREKLDSIVSARCLVVDHRRSPWRDFGPMFAFRRQLVHAKLERHIKVNIDPRHLDSEGWLTEVPHSLRSQWESACTLKTAERWRDAVSGMSAALSLAAGGFDPVVVDGGIDYWNTMPR